MEGILNNTNNKWWQLFKTGIHVSKSGEEFNAGTREIDKIVEATKNHSYANDEIPVCIGHKKEDSPKWGAFKKDSFKRAGDFLIGRYDYLVKEFAECISKKMFDKVSVALYPDLAIKHIAVLGVQAPAVKGLKSIELNEPADLPAGYEFETGNVGEFSEGENGGITSLLANIKNFIAGKFSEHEAESIIPLHILNNVNKPGINNSFSEEVSTNKKEITMPGITQQPVPQEFSEQISAYEKEISELKGKLLDSEIKEFCESPLMSGKITPALMPHIKSIYRNLSSLNNEIEFSEGEGKNKRTFKITPLESFKKVLTALPGAVEFGEYASKEKAGISDEPDLSEFAEMTVNDDSLELHRRALKIQSADKCSYIEALKKASQQ
jgi:hypothetical protein